MHFTGNIPGFRNSLFFRASVSYTCQTNVRKIGWLLEKCLNYLSSSNPPWVLIARTKQPRNSAVSDACCEALAPHLSGLERLRALRLGLGENQVSARGVAGYVFF